MSRRLGYAAVLALCSCQNPGVPALLVVDQDAGDDALSGGVFRVDPVTREVSLFATSPLFTMPQDILQLEDGSFLLLDYNGAEAAGKIFAISASGEVTGEVAIPKGLLDPYQFERAPDGSIWILDNNADPLGLGVAAEQDTGTVWRLSADFDELDIVASGPPIQAPTGLLFEDDGVFLLDADAFRREPYDLANGEGGIFRVRPDTAAVETVVRFVTAVSPLGLYREPSGSFVVVDANADPDPAERAKGRIRGALYRVDRDSGATLLFARHPDFRDPVTCTEWEGGLLVADLNADPLGLGDDGTEVHFGGEGRGGIYRVDLRSGEVELFVASPEFINPVRVRPALLPE